MPGCFCHESKSRTPESFFLPLQVGFQLQPARVYLEDTFVYYVKTLLHTYVPDSTVASASVKTTCGGPGSAPVLPEQVHPPCLVTSFLSSWSCSFVLFYFKNGPEDICDQRITWRRKDKEKDVESGSLTLCRCIGPFRPWSILCVCVC